MKQKLIKLVCQDILEDKTSNESSETHKLVLIKLVCQDILEDKTSYESSETHTLVLIKLVCQDILEDKTSSESSEHTNSSQQAKSTKKNQQNGILQGTTSLPGMRRQTI